MPTMQSKCLQETRSCLLIGSCSRQIMLRLQFDRLCLNYFRVTPIDRLSLNQGHFGFSVLLIKASCVCRGALTMARSVKHTHKRSENQYQPARIKAQRFCVINESQKKLWLKVTSDILKETAAVFLSFKYPFIKWNKHNWNAVITVGGRIMSICWIYC